MPRGDDAATAEAIQFLLQDPDRGRSRWGEPVDTTRSPPGIVWTTQSRPITRGMRPQPPSCVRQHGRTVSRTYTSSAGPDISHRHPGLQRRPAAAKMPRVHRGEPPPARVDDGGGGNGSEDDSAAAALAAGATGAGAAAGPSRRIAQQSPAKVDRLAADCLRGCRPPRGLRAGLRRPSRFSATRRSPQRVHRTSRAPNANWVQRAYDRFRPTVTSRSLQSGLAAAT